MSQPERLCIAQVYDGKYDTPGGLPNYTNTLHKYYQEQGHESVLIVGQTCQEAPHIIQISNNVPLPLNGNIVDLPLPISRRRAESIVRTVRPDILHVNMPCLPWAGARFITAAPENTAVVSPFHILPYDQRAARQLRALSWMLKPALQRIDRTLAAAPAIQLYAQSDFGLETEPVPCPVDVKRFRSGRRLPEYDDGKVNIVFLGRLEERKGVPHLLGALGMVDRSLYKDIRVLIGGRGHLEESLKRQADELNLTDQEGRNVVTFLGRVADENKADLLASADITVLPATSGESFGIVVVEAMAAGGVVVAGDNPGYRSILEKRTEEMLVASQNYKQFADTLTPLIQSAQYRAEIKDRQQRDLSEYDIPVVGSRILSIYRDALEQRRHRNE
jgi:phosphatidylinositol alpha-mannosyltransferase